MTDEEPARRRVQDSAPFVFIRNERVAVPGKALLATFLYCLIGSIVFVYGQDLSWVQAVYFMCVTMSTVGYGDISPDGPGLRAFTIVWIFVAILVVFPLLTGAIVLFTHGLTMRGRALFEKVFRPTLVDIDGDGTMDFAMPEQYAFFFFAKNLLPALLMWFGLQLICAAGFVGIEGANDPSWTFGAALYHCIITATTVGYGDMSIQTDGGMVWACFHILISVAMLGELVSSFDGLREEWSKKKEKVAQMILKSDPNFAQNLMGCIEGMDPRTKGTDKFNQMQFLLGMLVSSGLLPESELVPVKRIFSTAEVDVDGKISRLEVQYTTKLMQASLSVASGQGEVAMPVRAAKAVQRGLTDEELEALEREALAQLQGLTSIKLSLVKRQIVLLYPIEFGGHKSSGNLIDAQAAAEALPTFEKEERVRTICNEIGQALIVCNKLLVAKNCVPFGLKVAGHTSMETETSMETSTKRARAVSQLITEELDKLVGGNKCADVIAQVRETGNGTLPSGAQIVSVGFGATRKLPEYDDGKNHPQNRRVEVEILVGDEA